MFLFKKLAKPTENTCFCARNRKLKENICFGVNSLQNLRKPIVFVQKACKTYGEQIFLRKKLAKPKEHTCFCAKSIANLRNTYAFAQKACKTYRIQLFLRTKLRTPKENQCKACKSKACNTKACNNNKAYKIIVWGFRSSVIYTLTVHHMRMSAYMWTRAYVHAYL